MSEQNSLNIDETNDIENVAKYKFEPIKGYPMLNWHGKRPFTSTQYYPAQKKEVYGEEINGWINKIFWGDNLQVMSHLLKEYRGKVDLVYIDPPFDSKADYKKTIKIKGKDASSDESSFEEKQYSDIWTNDGYLQFMYERLILLRELLSNTGSIYLHCDWHKTHHLRCIMDEVFGENNFKAEIIYKRRHAHGDASVIGTIHDTLLFYTKTKVHTWNSQYEPYSQNYIDTYYRYSDDDGRKWLSRSTTAPGGRGPSYEWNGHVRAWRYTLENMQKLHNEGRIFYTKNGMPRYKQYLDEMQGLPVSSLWVNVKFLDSWSVEDEAYPTQKSEDLLDLIISASSNPGDLVFDCFMGSGTMQTVAMKKGRKFLGADINSGSIYTTARRLNKVRMETGEVSSANIGFEIYNVNNYELFRNPVEAKQLLLDALEIEALNSSIYDGEKDGFMAKIMPVNRIATREDLNELFSNFPYKIFEKRKEENPNKPVESILLICMGHEPDLKAHLEQESGYKLNVEVVDILRDKANIEFKRDSEAEISISDGKLEVLNFFPMNLMQKLSMQKESVNEWRELVESIVIDWNYGGAAMEPAVVDIPAKEKFIVGIYDIPDDAGAIKIKITDLLSEFYEEVIQHG